MKRTRKLTFFSIVILFSFIISLVFPMSALADDATPPPVETPQVVPLTEEPVVADTAPTALAATDALVADQTIATEPATTESSPTAPAVTEVPATNEAASTDQTSDASLTEIVQAAAENNVTLADPNGEPLGLGTTDAAETLVAGDPYFTRGGVTYRFLPAGGCAAYGGMSATCIESVTPIQAALDNVQANGSPDNSTVYVGPGTYAEQIVIKTEVCQYRQ